MIVDLRIYTVKPGRLAEFVAFYEQNAFAIQTRILGRCLGYYTSVEGTLNQVVHMWGYESQADREARRAAMAADPAWIDYIDRVNAKEFFLAQENRIIRPTAFSPVQ